MQQAQLGNEFQVLMQEAVFIKEYHLAFLEWVQVAGLVGVLRGLGGGDFEETFHQIVLVGDSIELLAEVRTR